MVLLVFMLMMALVAGIASTSFLFQRSVDSYTRDRLAENLGDSVIATAPANLKKNSDFADRLDFKDDAVDSPSRAWLTFEASDPNHSTLLPIRHISIGLESLHEGSKRYQIAYTSGGETLI